VLSREALATGKDFALIKSPRETFADTHGPGSMGTQLLSTEISFPTRFSLTVKRIRVLCFNTAYCSFISGK
jgi:hypothetical protein